MGIIWKLLLVVFICFINVLAVTCGVTCWNDKIPGQKIRGIVGEDINITCTMLSNAYESCNKTNYTTLYGNDKQKEIPSSDILFMNRTVVQFTLGTSEEMLGDTRLNVKCGIHILTMDEITIGTPPQNVTDFYCRFNDYTNSICRFKATPNYLRVNYQLEYHNGDESFYTCNVTALNDTNYYCKFDYVIIFDTTFYFTVTGSNYAGQNTQTFIIDHDSNVVPSMPDTQVTNITSRDIVLKWFIPKYSYYEKGLRYYIRYRPEGLEWQKKYLNKDRLLENISEKLELGYANRKYELEIRVRSLNINTNDDTREIWSDPFKRQFETLPRTPDNPPKIDSGGYYIDNSGNLFLYWERISKYHENADNFSYVITGVKINHTHVKIQPKNLTLLYAKYAYDGVAHYKFKIKSKNAEGMSSVASNIDVPARKWNYEDYLPQEIFKVYNNNNSSYNLSWTPPRHTKDLLSYTVFWCIQSAESHNACNLTGTNSIKFERIDDNRTWYIFVPPTHNFIFAVSANFKNYSSGMTWAKCGKATDTDYLPLTPDLSPISSTEIKVTWNLDCSEKTNLNKYNFTFCPIISNLSCSASNLTFDNAQCSSENETTYVVTKNEKEFRIKYLEPFTAYKVSMILYSDTKNGAKGKATSICTYQDAPTPPQELSVENVSETEATLKWLPPKQINGELKSYTIRYVTDVNGTEPKIIKNIIVSDKNAPSYRLKNLLGYTTYTINVTAETIKESQPQIVQFQTKIGRPSPPTNVKGNKTNDFYEFTWDKPSYPGGPIDYYEIKTTFKNGDSDNNVTKLEITSRVYGNRCKFNKPPCRKAHDIQFNITAVNVIKVDANRKRRHTKAEISQPAKNVNTNESINDNVENTKEITYPKKITKTIMDHNIDEEKIRKLFGDDFNKPLDCENKESIEEYDDIEKYEKIQSPPISRNDFSCESIPETNQSSIKDSILPLSVLVLIIMFISFYFGAKKFKKMTEIDLEMPEGLGDIMKEDTNVKCQDILKSHNDNTRSNESLGPQELNKSKEEKQHLLDECICNDSGSNIDNSAEDQDTKSQHADDSSRSTVEMMDYSNKSSPSESPQNSIRDNDIEEPVIKESKPVMLTNGYIEPKSIQSRPERTITGYTTLDAIGKPIIPTQSNLDIENNKLIIPILNHSPTIIGGYVTQKQLSEFGRLQ